MFFKSSKDRRKAICFRLRQEGAQAYRNGNAIETCPHKDMDRYQWEQGYLSAKSTDLALKVLGKERWPR